MIYDQEFEPSDIVWVNSPSTGLKAWIEVMEVLKYEEDEEELLLYTCRVLPAIEDIGEDPVEWDREILPPEEETGYIHLLPTELSSED